MRIHCQRPNRPRPRMYFPIRTNQGSNSNIGIHRLAAADITNAATINAATMRL